MSSEPITVVVQRAGLGVADVIDEARSMVEELELRGYQPDSVAVPRASYKLILDAKRNERARGQAVYLLGLDLLISEDVMAGEP